MTRRTIRCLFSKPDETLWKLGRSAKTDNLYSRSGRVHHARHSAIPRAATSVATRNSRPEFRNLVIYQFPLSLVMSPLDSISRITANHQFVGQVVYHPLRVTKDDPELEMMKIDQWGQIKASVLDRPTNFVVSLFVSARRSPWLTLFGSNGPGDGNGDQ